MRPISSESQEVNATEEELQAVLSGQCHLSSSHPNINDSFYIGKLTPHKIPVNIFLPSHNIVADSLFDTPDLNAIPQIQPRRPRIIMTSPEQPPISGMVEISVTYDEMRPRGIAVEVSGAMSSDIKLDVLEEICRRGGTLGLSGRVWSNASQLHLYQ